VPEPAGQPAAAGADQCLGRRSAAHLQTTIQHAFVQACRLDVLVRKPGNVSLASPGHRMTAQQFSASAQAAAAGLCQRGASVGQRIEAAVRASWQAAGCNTNLGIVLLCAPLAAAAERCALAAETPSPGWPPPADALRQALQQVLAGLTLADADAAFRAITLANPGGLGRAPAQDVHASASIDLRAAMALAADRDSIARQYRDGYADLFDLALPSLASMPGYGPGFSPTRGARPDADGGLPHGLLHAFTAAAVQRVFLVFLAGWPDSHIVRKHGAALAHSVMTAAQPWALRATTGERVADDPRWADWDARLKQQAINPGTSADLTVATLMLHALLSTDDSDDGTERDNSSSGAVVQACADQTQNPIQEIEHHGKN